MGEQAMNAIGLTDADAGHDADCDHFAEAASLAAQVMQLQDELDEARRALVLRLQPGDRLAYIHDGQLSREQGLRLKADLVRWVGIEPHRVAVLAGGELRVVRDEEGG